MKKPPKYLNQWSRKDFLRLPQEILTHSYTSLIIFPTRKNHLGFWVRYVLVGCTEGVPIAIHLCEDVVWSCPGVLIDCLRNSKAFRFRRGICHSEDLDKTFQITKFGYSIKVELV